MNSGHGWEDGHAVPTEDFALPGDSPQAADALSILADLLDWSGTSRARHAVLLKLLGLDNRSQSDLARFVGISRQRIAEALKDGRAELKRRASARMSR